MDKDTKNIILYGGLVALGIYLLSDTGKEDKSKIISPGSSNSPTDFIKKYLPFALQSQIATGVPAVVTLAQAGLESSWGKHAYGNNFFGIKAGGTWNGAIQKLKTWECSKTNDELIKIYSPNSHGSNPNCNSKGKPSYRVYSKFRAYSSPEQGFIDHGYFLKNNSRYKKAFDYKNNPTQFALEIAKAGYATAPNYASILVQTVLNVQKVL